MKNIKKIMKRHNRRAFIRLTTEKIVSRVPKDELLIHYKIADFEGMDELLENIY